MAWHTDIAEHLQRAWRERALVLKAASFAAVGVVNAAVDFGVFAFAYYYLALPIVASNVIAWCVAVTGSYVMNSLTTFANESGRQLRLKSYMGFAVSQSAGLLANTATVLIASYLIPVWLAKVLAIGVSFLVNFSLSHFVVFRQNSDRTHGGG